jgi:hypothetical protein
MREAVVRGPETARAQARRLVSVVGILLGGEEHHLEGELVACG